MAVVIVSVVTIVTIIIAGIITLIVIVIVCNRQWLQQHYICAELGDDPPIVIELVTCTGIQGLKLKPIDPAERIIKTYEVRGDWSLTQFVKKNIKDLTFKRCCFYYEFTHSEECITEDQKLIFMDKDTKEFFYSAADPKELHTRNLLGLRVGRPSFDKYTVFVQCTGLGKRHLGHGSRILYEQWQPHLWWHIDPKLYRMEKLKDKCTIKVFCENHRLKSVIKCTIFIELDEKSKFENESHRQIVNQKGVVHCKPQGDDHDVIIFDKDSEKLLTGPHAHDIVEQHNSGAEKTSLKRWRIFVSRDDENVQLEKDTWIVYLLQEQLKPLPPLMCLDSHQFETTIMVTKIQLEDFRKEHNLVSNQHDVFVEKQWEELEEANVKGNEMILMDKDSNMFFTGLSSWNEAKKYTNESDVKWKMFIQVNSKLLKNSCVLFRKQWKAGGLLPVFSKQFVMATLNTGVTCSKFCKDNGGMNLFLELDSFPHDKPVRDVILMDMKDTSTKTYYSGPYARHVVEKYFNHDSTEDKLQNNWMVFVLSSSELDDLNFGKKVRVLYQKEKQETQKFKMLKVDEDNVRISSFIKRKLSPVESEKVFYELDQGGEDLLYYQETVLMKQKAKKNKIPEEVSCEMLSFYAIADAPGMGIKHSCGNDGKMFIQSVCQGSRCLKKGSLLLYKIK